MTTNYILGQKAEQLAAQFLQNKGWNIIDTNYRANRDGLGRYGEIDIIATSLHNLENLLIAVEVKASKSNAYLPYMVTHKQQTRIRDSIIMYMEENPKFASYNLRFDAILVRYNTINNLAIITHIENAWLT